MPADGDQLVEALRLLAAAGVLAWDWKSWHPLFTAGYSGHPMAVWHFLQELAPADTLPSHERGQLANAVAAAGNRW